MSVNIPIRWSDNTKELAEHLKAGTGQIEATRAAAEKMAASLGGDKLIRAAHTYVAALSELGQGQGALAGAAKLTAAELDRGNALLDKAVAKYTALGRAIPPAIVELQQFITAQKQAGDQAQKTAGQMDAMTRGMTAAGQTSVASAKLVAGMSASGAEAAKGLTKADSGLQSYAKSLGMVNGLMGSLGLGISIGALVSVGKAALDDADALTKLSDKTSVGVETLQRWRIATDDAGNSLEDLAGAVNKMQKNFGSKNEGAIAAVHELGLNFEHLSTLSTEDKFYEIAAALAKVEDADKQVTLATAIMGKGAAEILPTIKRGFDDVKDAAVGMSKETVFALDSLGDSIASLARGLKGFSGTALVKFLQQLKVIEPDDVLKARQLIADVETQLKQIQPGTPAMFQGAKAPGLPADLKDLDAAFDRQVKAVNKTVQANEEYEKKLEAINVKIREATRDVGHLSDAQKTEALRLDALGLSVDEIGFKMKLSGEAVRRFLSANTELEKELDRVDKDLERITTHVSARAIPAFTGLTMTWQQMLNTGKGLTYDGLIPMAKGFDDLSRAQAAETAFTDAQRKSHEALQAQLARTIGLMPDLSGAAKEHFLEAGGAATQFANVYEDALKGLPAIMQHAFEGGGGLSGAAKSLGTQLANDVIVSYAAKMKDAGHPLTLKQNAAIGAGTAGAAAVGSELGGPTAGMIAGVASGIGGAALAASATGAGLAAAGVGGAIALGAATMGIGAAAVGVYLLAKHFLTVSQNEKDARVEFAKLQDLYGSLPATVDAVGHAYAVMGYSGEEAQAALQRALDATHESAQAEDEALRPIVAILADAETRSTNLATGIEAITTAAQAFGGTVPDQFKAAVTQLTALRGVTDEQRAALLALTQDVKPNFEALTQTAAKYGVTLEGLGKSFQQADLEGRAKAITGDFEALTKAGGDAGGILAGMADEISQLVTDSKKFGTAIPENMRPLIDELLRAGKLTDENGDKLEDVSNISFEATPIDDSMTKLADAIDKLTASLTDLTHMTIPPIVVPVTYATTGAPTTAPALPAFASGSGGFQDFGTGTLAVLHGREAVVTEGQVMRADYALRPPTATSAAATAGGDVHVTFAISTLDATDFKTVVEQKVFPALINQLRRGRGLTAMHDVLGR